MNFIKCANGHYYDTDKFSGCPFCAELQKHDVTQTIPAEVDLGEDTSETVQIGISGTKPKKPASNEELIGEIERSLPEDQISLVTERDVTTQDVTVGYYANLIGREPVVGFLVCTKGEYFGDSFSLKSGRNFVGRAQNMDIVLDMDPMVSRERHAIIIYEPRSRTFIAQPGDSHEMFYINDNVVLSNETLKAYDTISIGNTNLMLIPCCGPEFSWEDLKNE